MSVSVTFTIAGKQALEFKERMQHEALIRGLSMSEWLVEAAAEYIRKRSHEEPEGKENP